MYLFVCLLLSIHSESGAVTVLKNHDENELPGPPSKPQVTDVTKNSVSLSWQPGMAGASPVSSFVIEAFRFVLPITSDLTRWLLAYQLQVKIYHTLLKR